jgi:hypothetical protein
MATNGFASAPFTAATSGNAGTNAIYLTKVTLIQAATVTAVLLNTPSATSGISFKALIYDGSHSALLGTGAIVTAVASGYNRFALTGSLSLAAGTYYVGYVCANSLNVSVDTSQPASTSWYVSSGIGSVSAPANPLSGGSTSAAGLQVALEFDGSSAAAYGFAPDFTSGVTRSAANAVATLDAARNEAARSVVTCSAVGGGKFYAEILFSGTVDSTTYVGVLAACFAMSSVSTSNFIRAISNNGGLVPTGGAGPSFSSGDVIGVAYDATNGLLWLNKNNGPWFGTGGAPNPATGVSGLAVGAGNWPVTVGALSAAATVFNLRDTSDRQSYSPPSGFSSWSPASTAISSAPGAGAILITGFAPSIALTATPAAGAITVTGFAPSIGQAATPASGAISFTGLAPSPDITVVPASGAISFTGLAPSLDVVGAPASGAIMLTGFAPAPVANSAVSPASGGITFTGYAPTIHMTLSLTAAFAPVSVVTGALTRAAALSGSMASYSFMAAVLGGGVTHTKPFLTVMD